MRDFLEPGRSRKLLSRFEVVCFSCSGVCVVVALLPDLLGAPLAGVLGNVGVGLFGAAAGSVARGMRWRRLLSRHALDVNARVFYERGDYARIIEYVDEADEVDLMGISLQYALELIKDHPAEYVRKVRFTRMLLPGRREICDDRDRAQNTEPGGLWDRVRDVLPTIEQVKATYPAAFDVRYFVTQPYVAMIRVDRRIWVSPYLTMSGRSCPVIAVAEQSSPELFAAFSAHFETVWSRSLRKLGS